MSIKRCVCNVFVLIFVFCFSLMCDWSNLNIDNGNNGENCDDVDYVVYVRKEWYSKS